jgi:actin-related protein 9
VSWPFANGDIADYIQAEAIWCVVYLSFAFMQLRPTRKHILFTLLGIKRTHNESPTLLSFPHGLSRDAHEKVCQIFFERLNTAAFSVLERPLAQLYAVNSLSGLVVDIGDEKTDITPIYDCFIQHNCCQSIPVGIHDCEKYLVHIFKNTEDVVKALSPPDAPLSPEQLNSSLLELVRKAWRDGLMKSSLDNEVAIEAEDEGVTNIAAVIVAGKEKAVIESGMKKRAVAKATAAELARAKEIEALDLVTVELGEKSVTIGKDRHRFCEPLFDPKVLVGVEGIEQKDWKSASPIPLQDACGVAVSKADLIARTTLWDGLFVTGEITSLVKGTISLTARIEFHFVLTTCSGIGVVLQNRLKPYLLGNPDHINDVQPKYVRVLHVPDYFAEYRDKGDSNAAFLGASIVAKVSPTAV